MKMQSYLLSCLTACLVFVFTACSKKDKAPFLYISITPKIGLLDSTIGSTTSFNVSSNIQWKIAVSPASAASWLQLDKTSGENTADVKLTVIGKDNSAGADVVITVSAADNSATPPATYTVSQKAFFNSNRDALFLEGPVNSYDSFTVTSNVQWKITRVPSWLQADTTVKPGGKTLIKVVAAADNNTARSLMDTVTLTPIGSSSLKPVSIQVYQKANWGIHRFSPEEGAPGSDITLYGVFDENPKVYLSGYELTIKSKTANQIVATIPASLTLGGTLSVLVHPQYFYNPKYFTLLRGWNPRGKWTYDNQYTTDGITFAYNGAIYFGLGKPVAANVKGEKTIYKLDPATYTLTPAFTIPTGMLSRSNPFSFILNSKVYIGGGKSFDNKDLHDVWELDPANGAWRQMTSLPNSGIQNMGYSGGSVGFVQSLQDSKYPSGSTMYTLSVNGPTDPGTWSADQNINLTRNMMSVFTLKNVGWFGGGYDINTYTMSSNFYRYSPLIAGLVDLQGLTEPGNLLYVRAPAFSIGDKGYIFSRLQNLYEYDPVNNTWTFKSSLPYSIEGGAAAIGTRIFAWNKWGNIYEYLP